MMRRNKAGSPTPQLFRDIRKSDCCDTSSRERPDCVICTRARPSDPEIDIVQIIEILKYRRGRSAHILLLLVVANRSKTSEAGLRITHPGKVTVKLKRLDIKSSEECESLVLRLYQSRLAISEQPDQIKFRARLSYAELADEIKEYSTLGPGACFSDGERCKKIDPEVEKDLPADAPFTSFLLPRMNAEEQSIFLIELDLVGEAYKNLVGRDDRFSVDSYARLKRDLEANALPKAPIGFRDHYEMFIGPDSMNIGPKAYDIVILQKLGDPVIVERGSLYITPVKPADSDLDDEVLWFLGRPEDFYLRLRYADEEQHQELPCARVAWEPLALTKG
jgi:hypothetical protein